MLALHGFRSSPAAATLHPRLHACGPPGRSERHKAEPEASAPLHFGCALRAVVMSLRDGFTGGRRCPCVGGGAALPPASFVYPVGMHRGEGKSTEVVPKAGDRRSHVQGMVSCPREVRHFSHLVQHVCHYGLHRL